MKNNDVLIMKVFRIFMYIAIALAVVVAGVCWLAKIYLFAGAPQDTKRLYIPADATEQTIADSIKVALGEDYGSKVVMVWNAIGGRPELAHGSYLVKPGTTVLAFARQLRSGSQTPVRVTFNNMRTLEALAGRMSVLLELDSAQFIEALKAKTPELNDQQRPAVILPDTYEFYWTATPERVVNSLLNAYSRFWTPERCAKAKALGLDSIQVATIASIVEEESAKNDERPKIARLYLNRLKIGMPLQADPTIKFALGDWGLKRIKGEHLKVESPYNTYTNKGLPPGPIRIPEAATLDAVLNAPAHDYLYMCAKSDFSGYHDFATDYNRHRINAARYHRALSKLGI